MPELETSNPFNVEYPTGKFFVGREQQLLQLKELLTSLASGVPSNLYVEGKGGEGKTSYLDRIVEEARKRDMLAFRCNLDIGKAAEETIDTIIRALLRELEQRTHQEGIEADWSSKEDSMLFRSPRLQGIRSDDLALDFKKIHGMLNDVGIRSCVICIDEGQRIDSLALSAIKNSLQSVKLGYMIVLSLLIDEKNADAGRTGRDLLNDLAIRSGDPGASRFFQNASVIGPFDTQVEAEQCISKRLENNKIKFSQSAIGLIAHIMGRHPRKMVILAHRAYEITKRLGLAKVDEEIIDDAFRKEHVELVKETIEFKGTLSSLAIKTYVEFAKLDINVTAMEITKRMFPELESEALASISTTIQSMLDKLAKKKFCKKLDSGSYRIPQPEFAYALKLVLGG